jgi:hypothetical protein
MLLELLSVPINSGGTLVSVTTADAITTDLLTSPSNVRKSGL